MNWYISDTHFGQANIIEIDRRPYKRTDEMDRDLIDRWNKKVSEDDDVYIVGDFAWHKADPVCYLKQLKGRKHLITGNHDERILKAPEALLQLASVDSILCIKDQGKFIVLCHYPMLMWEGMELAALHIYGHIHKRTLPALSYMNNSQLSLNAGCMINDYQPVSLSEIIRNNQIWFQRTETTLLIQKEKTTRVVQSFR